MEFEQNTPSSDQIDESTRLAASNRQLTIAPMHDDVTPEDEPDDLVAARHILGSPIGNIETDSEATVPISVVKQEKANHRIALAGSIIIMLIVGTATAIAFLSR